MKRRILIKGDRVQDVGYRLFLLEAAEQLGLKGFQARNVGKHVECLVEGDEEAMKDFLDFVRTNYPEMASVSEIVDEEYGGRVMSVEGFYRLFSLQQLVKIVNAGVKMLDKQDSMLEKQDEMLKKQEETISEIRALRQDLKSWMEERFSKIEREIEEIKARIGMSR